MTSGKLILYIEIETSDASLTGNPFYNLKKENVYENY